jgi:hypothetical protein
VGHLTQVIALADGVTVATDGTVYFTDVSVLPPQGLPEKGLDVGDAVLDSILQGPSGRLLRYSPATGETTVLMKALWFANGVALSADESYVLVAASISNRIHRYWLKGPKVHTETSKPRPPISPISPVACSPHAATKQLRIVTLRFGTGRQRMLLERWTNPQVLRRSCTCEYNRVEQNRRASRNGLVSSSPTRNPVTIRNFCIAAPHRCCSAGRQYAQPQPPPDERCCSFLAQHSLTLPRVLQANTHELFTVLPGVPDGLSLAPDGGFWVALYMELPFYVSYACDCTGTVNLNAVLAGEQEADSMLFKPMAARPAGMVAKLSSDGQVRRRGTGNAARARDQPGRWGTQGDVVGNAMTCHRLPVTIERGTPPSGSRGTQHLRLAPPSRGVDWAGGRGHTPSRVLQ